jgi:hypothetical protein
MLALAAGPSWPTTEGETLAGGRLRLPDAAKGQPALILFTFTREAGTAAKPWASRFLKDFPAVPVYQVAMLEKAPRLVRGLIRSGMRKDMPPVLQARTVLLYTGDAAWRTRLGISDDALPYVAILNTQGQVAWDYRGAFSETEFQKLKSHAV